MTMLVAYHMVVFGLVIQYGYNSQFNADRKYNIFYYILFFYRKKYIRINVYALNAEYYEKKR